MGSLRCKPWHLVPGVHVRPWAGARDVRPVLLAPAGEASVHARTRGEGWMGTAAAAAAVTLAAATVPCASSSSSSASRPSPPSRPPLSKKSKLYPLHLCSNRVGWVSGAPPTELVFSGTRDVIRGSEKGPSPFAPRRSKISPSDRPKQGRRYKTAKDQKEKRKKKTTAAKRLPPHVYAGVGLASERRTPPFSFLLFKS